MFSADPRSVAGGLAIINRKSTPYSDITLPKFVTDPLYTSSQSQLDKLGSGLISGEGIPDYYKPIGDFNSPQFQAMLNAVKGQVMQGSQEASAIQGTGRSGVATTASNNALNNILPQLTYTDYTRALQGRGALLDTGINTEQGVRQSAQLYGQDQTNFNENQYQNQIKQAGLIDAYKKDSASSTGQMIGTIVGGIGGFALGGPQGAMIGAGLGGSIGGGGGGSSASSLSAILPYLGGYTSPVTAPGGGAIQDPKLGSFAKLNSSNPDVSSILYGGR